MLEDLIQRIRALSAAELQSEDAACDALVALRFPAGIVCPDCGADCKRSQAHVTCRGGGAHSFTILVNTPLETKTRPRIRALLLAIQALSTSRSISARELGRLVGAPYVTLWRHVMTLRAMLPRAPREAGDTTTIARATVARDADITVAVSGKRTPAGAHGVAQAVRTWLHGTFHGVSGGWLSLYLREIAARWAYGAELVAGALMERLVVGGARLVFRSVRALAAPPQG